MRACLESGKKPRQEIEASDRGKFSRQFARQIFRVDQVGFWHKWVICGWSNRDECHGRMLVCETGCDE
jgi:hypothetical protein